MIRIRVQKRLAVHNPSDMPFPKQQISPPKRGILGKRLAQRGLLHVAVPATSDPAGSAPRLHQTRAIYPEGRVPPPEVRRPEQSLRHSHRVVLRLHTAQVHQRHKPFRHLRKAFLLAQNAKTAAHAQAGAIRTFHIGLRINMRRPRAHHMCRVTHCAKARFTHISDIAIKRAHDISPAIKLLQDSHSLPRQKLTVPLAVWRTQQIHHRQHHLLALPFYKFLRLDLPLQVRSSDATVVWRGAAVAHSFSITGSASSKARAAMPTPPLGRAGLAAGFQPYTSKCA